MGAGTSHYTAFSGRLGATGSGSSAHGRFTAFDPGQMRKLTDTVFVGVEGDRSAMAFEVVPQGLHIGLGGLRRGRGGYPEFCVNGVFT